MREDCPSDQERGKLTREAALFLAVYGRLPADFDKETAMGLAQNIPMIEARNALTTARAISIAFGSPEATQQAIYAATGNDELAWKVRMQMAHQKAVAQ